MRNFTDGPRLHGKGDCLLLFWLAALVLSCGGASEPPATPSTVIGAPAATDGPSPAVVGDAAAGVQVTLLDAQRIEDVRKPPICESCEGKYQAAIQIGAVTDESLDEISGLVSSPAQPTVLFVHNDSPKSAGFAAINMAGELLARYGLAGAPHDDLEDMARGPCPSGSCLFIADAGNNHQDRTDFAILRTAEPIVDVKTKSDRVISVPWERFRFRYPVAGFVDSEAMVVDPTSGMVYVITKPAPGKRSTVYRIPLLAGPESIATAEKVSELPVPRPSDSQTTGASAHPCRRGFLLRTYNTLFEFMAPLGGTFEAAFQATPQVVPVAKEFQGEAVTYLPDGRGYVTISETKNRIRSTGMTVAAPVNQVKCTLQPMGP